MRRVVAVTLAAICAGSLLGVGLAAAAASGSIAGVVTNPSGNGIANVSVSVFSGGLYVAGATTASDGSYSVGQLASGSYTVGFRPPPPPPSGPDTGNYLPQNYDGRAPSAGADPVAVLDGNSTTGVDAVLQPGGTISGVVTDSSGNPLAGISVEPYDADGVAVGYAAATASDGSYTLDRLPTGEYTVGFQSNALPPHYVPDFFGGAPTAAGAHGVAVTAGSNTPNVNVHLTGGATLTGTVTDDANAPIAGVEVTLYDSAGDFVAGAVTGADGTFALTGVAGGSYRLGFAPVSSPFPMSPGPNYLPTYDGADTLAGATVINVVAASTTADLDVQLAAGGEIEGAVTDAASKPIAGVEVTAYASDGTPLYVATTAADGTYVIAGLSSGAYKLGFDPSYSPAPQNDVAQFDGGSSLASATPISLTAGGAPAVINAQLAAGATISGVVTDSLGDPADDVPVVAYDTDGNVVAGATSAHFTGDYEIIGLPAGTYRIGFDRGSCCSSGDYAPQFSGDQSTLASAATVTVGAGGAATGVDAALAPGGHIAGEITDADGSPLSGIHVDAIDSSGTVVAATDSLADGSYTLFGLASGTYRLQYVGSFAGASPLVNTDYYPASSTLAGATGIAVTAGTTTSGVDVRLARVTGSLVGVVTGGSAGPLAGAAVTLYDSSGSIAAAATSGRDGTFQLAGLEPGFYRVGFALAGRQPQYYPDATSLPGAEAVYVASADTAAGIDADLALTAPGGPQTSAPAATPQTLPPAPESAEPQPSLESPPASITESLALISVKRLKLSPQRLLEVPVRCLQARPCGGRISMSVRHRGSLLKLAGATVEIASNGERHVKVRLSGEGARLLAAAHDRLRVTITLSVGSGAMKQTLQESVLIV